MSSLGIYKIIQKEPSIKLLISNGSERGDFMPLETLISKLGGIHSGVNLMSEYYPTRLSWPKRTLFSKEVIHYRHWYKDETEITKMSEPEEGTDGYYPFEIDNPENVVIKQMENVRRHGHDIRLTLTADITTKNEDLEKIADLIKDFGPIQLRLNHEANGNTWFRFAQSVEDLKSKDKRDKLYHNISLFFIRANRIITKHAPNVRMIACYNGPAESLSKQIPQQHVYHYLSPKELGLMYQLPNIDISIDQYLSLHYGWPGHKIPNPPIIGPVTDEEHCSFAIEPADLFHRIILPFQQLISNKRQQVGIKEETRIDLGEMNCDQDIHGPEIAAELINCCYDYIKKNPKAIASTVFYHAVDMGGLGLFQQQCYDNLIDIRENQVTAAYRKIMKLPEFQHPTTRIHHDPLYDLQEVEMRWQSSCDAEGFECFANDHVRIDFKAQYMRRIVFIDKQGNRTYAHEDAQSIDIPHNTELIQVFALPPDGRNTHSDGFHTRVPVPCLI
jgi:hypothetical protein